MSDTAEDAGRQLFTASAALLGGEPTASLPPGLHRAAADLLVEFDWTPVAAPANDQVVANRLALLRFAAAIGGVFRMRARHAPALVTFGGLVRGIGADAGSAIPPASVTGSGFSAAAAFEACIGEAAEYASLFDAPPDAVFGARLADLDEGPADERLRVLLRAHGEAAGVADAPFTAVRARALAGGAVRLIPAAMVLRAADGSAPAVPWGTGVAAGPTFADATAAALLEAVERDAVARWWIGRRPARPIALEELVDAGAGECLARLRGPARTRLTTLLDITGDIALPTVAAVSFDRDGRGFAAGFACRTTLAAAIAAAAREMAQMELGHDVVAAKQARLGEAALNEADRRQRRRAAAITPERAGVAAGLAGPHRHRPTPDPTPDPTPSDPAEPLQAAGFTAYVVDCTRPALGIPVAAVIVPGLQPYPSVLRPRGPADPNSPDADEIDLF